MLFAGAWMLLGWSLVVCMVIAGIASATCMPFGTVLGVFTVIVLVRPSVKELFRAPAV